MRSHQQLVYTLPQLVDLPTGNVHLLSDQVDDDGPRREWVICDADGSELEHVTGCRAHAVRQMSVVAGHGASLPLVLYGPDGHPTGDRLPG